MKYRARNNYVLVRAVPKGQTPGGVVVPETASDGHDFHVVAVGGKVEGLQKGDRVIIAPEKALVIPGVAKTIPEGRIFHVSGETDLFIVPEDMVAMVVVNPEQN